MPVEDFQSAFRPHLDYLFEGGEHGTGVARDAVAKSMAMSAEDLGDLRLGGNQPSRTGSLAGYFRAHEHYCRTITGGA